MSQFLVHLHQSKEAHVGAVIERTHIDRRDALERLLTDAFIAGARAAVDGIGDQEAGIVADRLAAMETERRRARDGWPAFAVLPWPEEGSIIEGVNR